MLAEPTSTGADDLSRQLGSLPTQLLVGRLAAEFHGRIALVSSFGAEAAVLLHMVAEADPAMPVLFLDTGVLFEETLSHRALLVQRLGLVDVRSIMPDAAERAAEDPENWLWASDPDACCALRKVRPLRRALAPFDAWITGRKRYQSGARAALPVFEREDGRLKVNPLAAWDAAAIEAYRTAHGLPAHPLVAKGYRSIGCRPCTGAVRPGEHPRSGRWRGQGKVECGIHRAVSEPAAA